MNKDKIYQIGVLLGNVHTQHPKELILGIYEAAENENVNVTLFPGAQGGAIEYWQQNGSKSSSAYNYQFNALYDYALICKLDALIISYGTICIYLPVDSKEQFFQKFRSVPLIILEEYEEKSVDNYIMSDNLQSMKQIMEHLIKAHGYKKIAHLAGPKNNMDAKDRLSAYLEIMDKYHLPVTESMVEYGDYSTDVDSLVEKLIDNNPGLEAICCANDEMAFSAYNVCAKRGLIVGKDLAITGYDDMEAAKRMDPPLTTANQDGIDIGFRALKLALSACNTSLSKSIKIPANFKRRGSCGCNYFNTSESGLMYTVLNLITNASDFPNIWAAASCAANNSMQSINTEKSVETCTEFYDSLIKLLLNIIDDDYSSKEDITKRTVNIIQSLFNSPQSSYLDMTHFSTTLHQLYGYYLGKQLTKAHGLMISHVNDVTNMYLESYILQRDNAEITRLEKKHWMVPAMIQQMIEAAHDEQLFYELAMEHIKIQGAKSAFILVHSKPQKVEHTDEFIAPEKLYLASKLTDDTITSYTAEERPVITKEDGISSLYPDSPGHNYVAFILFSKEYQYGLMLCEIDATAVGDMYGLGLQISTAQAFLQITNKENSTKERLMATLKDLEDKNQVLSFISANDQLTGLYNRRGFMEHAINKIRESKGRQAYIFFSDLDHLKEINDVFGHSEGDYALTHASSILHNTFYQLGFSGRIGGDEFVSLVISDNEGIVEAIMSNLKDEMNKLNQESNKPYYVEFSTGYEPFICTDDTPITEIISKADEVLYEAKKSRRLSIVRT